MTTNKTTDEIVVIYVKWITRNGKKIPPPAGKTSWRLEIPRDKYRG